MNFIALDQLALWRHAPEKTAKARALLIHGIGEHSGRHLTTVENLVENDIEVIRFDLRGCGKSGGMRQWIDHFEDYVEDATKVFNWIQSNLSELPLFVHGHSLGGCIATYFASVYGPSLQGLMLCAPAFQVGDAYSAWKIAIGKIFAKAAPHFRMIRSSDPSALSRDPEVTAAYLRDPLCCSFNTLRQGSEILNALPGMEKAAGAITTPTVIFHGSADRVIRMEGSFSLLNALQTKNKVLHVLPNSFHELHNDLDKTHYFSLMNLWLKHQLKEKKTAQKKSRTISGSTHRSSKTFS